MTSSSTGLRRPSVLLVIVDDLRPDLGAYGREWARTPHIDALSRRSVTFTNAHAAVANCNPSRAALLTGRTPCTSRQMRNCTHSSLSI